MKDINIKHFSDLHFNKKFDLKILDNILKIISDGKTDYVCFTGDLLDTSDFLKNEIRLKNVLIDWFKTLGSCATVIVALGNHDVLGKKRRIQNSGYDFEFWDELSNIENVYLLYNNYYEDENVYICGIFPPIEYYLNASHDEDKNVLIEHLKQKKTLLENLDSDKLKILLHHSPVYMTDINVLNYIKEFDLILSGHMHNGLILPIFEKVFPKNKGLVGAYIRPLPKIARGILDVLYDKKKIKLIISGGIMKIVLPDSILGYLDYLFPASIENITFDGNDCSVKTINFKK